MQKHSISIAAAILGKRGGQAKTPSKVLAAKINGRKGGRPSRPKKEDK